MTKASDALVSTEWLASHLESPDIRVIDAGWYHPSTGKIARDDYEAGHIPSAVFFDIDAIADRSRLPLPHMLPDAGQFAAQVSALGLGNASRLVVYDRSGGAAAAARVWWTFRVFGHKAVAVLDGGWTKWQTEGRAVETAVPSPAPASFTPRLVPALVRDKAAMLTNVATRRDQVIDARSRVRFRGEAVEPWPHIKVGHIPGSLNLPWDEVIDPATQTLLPSAEIARRLAAAGLDFNRPAIASCGSGVTASMLAFAAYLAGKPDLAVYDGSWAEWGLAEDTPVEII